MSSPYYTALCNYPGGPGGGPKFGFHSAKYSKWNGDWRIDGNAYRLCIDDIQHLLTDDKKQTVKLDEICWKGYNLGESKIGPNCICCNGARYKSIHLSNDPSVIVTNMSNPANRKYRMVDGKHRLHRLVLNGSTEGVFYVLDYSEIKEYMKRIHYF
jgi:hypothetical protein